MSAMSSKEMFNRLSNRSMTVSDKRFSRNRSITRSDPGSNGKRSVKFANEFDRRTLNSGRIQRSLAPSQTSGRSRGSGKFNNRPGSDMSF